MPASPTALSRAVEGKTCNLKCQIQGQLFPLHLFFLLPQPLPGTRCPDTSSPQQCPCSAGWAPRRPFAPRRAGFRGDKRGVWKNLTRPWFPQEKGCDTSPIHPHTLNPTPGLDVPKMFLQSRGSHPWPKPCVPPMSPAFLRQKLFQVFGWRTLNRHMESVAVVVVIIYSAVSLLRLRAV